MFWMRNKENNFPIPTLIWRPDWTHKHGSLLEAFVPMLLGPKSHVLTSMVTDLFQ